MQVAFEEKEWELDQLEKLKEEQEAEIDEDNEPLFYESTWSWFDFCDWVFDGLERRVVVEWMCPE